ncbi:Copper transporter 6-like [Plakobranchus ocellatus]|uniref:Copper transporter 6-like n=1 Tax=Plakobranchus ocellatus TaxID=259542 RepID=A0AAV4ANX0_9GAST|nr:Copper transporter 6-like [Plakobranchus ocellatus]
MPPQNLNDSKTRESNRSGATPKNDSMIQYNDSRIEMEMEGTNTEERLEQDSKNELEMDSTGSQTERREQRAHRDVRQAEMERTGKEWVKEADMIGRIIGYGNPLWNPMFDYGLKN